VAAALAALLQGSAPFLLAPKEEPRERPEAEQRRSRERGEREPRTPRDRADGAPRKSHGRAESDARRSSRDRDEGQSQEVRARHERADGEPLKSGERPDADARRSSREPGDGEPRKSRPPRGDGPPMESFRIEVGHVHGVQPGNIVGAIANEAGLEGRHIGHIDIREDHSFVDLPEGMPKEIFRELKKVRVRGVELRIRRVDSAPRRSGH
jgi:ATP-dependent RNA helicase DeaD